MTARAAISPSTPPAYAAPAEASAEHARARRAACAGARSDRRARRPAAAARRTRACRRRPPTGARSTSASEVAHERRQRDVDDRVVDDDGEQARAQHAQREPAAAGAAHDVTAARAARARAARALVDQDHDAEGDQPHAPEDVADEVRGVDRPAARAARGRRRGRAPRTPRRAPGTSAGVAPPERDDDEHRPRGGEEVAERLADGRAEDVARGRERVAGVAAMAASLAASERSRARGSASAAGR